MINIKSERELCVCLKEKGVCERERERAQLFKYEKNCDQSILLDKKGKIERERERQGMMEREIKRVEVRTR